MATQKTNYSIHPRNWYQVDKGFNKGVKQNTSKPRNDSRKGTLAFREAARSARRTAMSATIAASKTPQAYKVPGSMKGW